MKRLQIGFGLIALAVLGLSPARTEAATVTNLQARVSKGQTFLTFTQVSGTVITYNVYRSTSPITSISGLTPIAILPTDSGKNPYTGQNLVICDLCQPLPSNTGLLVWTTQTSGNYYYAVTNSQTADLTISNTIGPVAEAFFATPGAVLLGTASNVGGGGHTQYRYMAWEDCATWRHNSWGYYGHRFDVYVPESVWGMKPPYPLILRLHGAGNNGYHEPEVFTNTGRGIIIHPVDLNYIHGLTDPYSGVGYPHSKWFGRFDSSTDVVKPVTEDRVVRYTKLVRDNPIFQIDPTRVYVTGASLGSGAMHLASHNPAIFAAAAASIGWINDDAWLSNAPQNTIKTVNSTTGPLWKDYQDMAWMAQQGIMVPIIHTFNKDDSTISPAAYPSTLQTFETNKQPYVAKWQNGNHTEFGLSGAWDYKRFKKDEPYPAFASASNSDPFSIQEGQRNINLDWSSALRDFNTASTADNILDTQNNLGMSFRSLNTDATATVTIHNAQIFRPSPGEVINWTNASQISGQLIQSGTIQADSKGLVTLTMQILTAGNRLTLSRSVVPLQPPAAPSALLVK